MRRVYAFISLILTITVPALALTPRALTRPAEHVQFFDLKILNSNSMKYDDIVTFLEDIENDAFISNCNAEDLNRINQFLALLAKEGMIVDNLLEKKILDQDIQMLFRMEEKHASAFFERYVIIPAVFDGHAVQTILCKSWFSKQWRQTKHFVKKHKKALLIGAAVVVAVTAIVYAASAIAAAKAAAAAAAAGGATATDASPKTDREIATKTEEIEQQSLSKEESNEDISSIDTPSLQEAPNVTAVLREGVSVIQESFFESDIQSCSPTDPNLQNRIKDFSARMAHEILDGISQLTEPFPQLAVELQEIGNRFFPKIASECPLENTTFNESPVEKFENMIVAIHQKIDTAFSTNQTEEFLDKKACKNLVLGILPPPGQLAFLQEEALIASYEKFKSAESFLKLHNKTFMSENNARALIHQCGIETFPRPVGIPNNFRVKISKKGGIKYYHPDHEHTSIRVMPGKPHSPLTCQQKPYIKYTKDGKSLDKFGKVVLEDSPEAHIALEEFIYRE